MGAGTGPEDETADRRQPPPGGQARPQCIGDGPTGEHHQRNLLEHEYVVLDLEELDRNARRFDDFSRFAENVGRYLDP